MATYHTASTAPRRVAQAGLEVLTHWDQHHPTARAATEAPTDWGTKLSPFASRTRSWDTDIPSYLPVHCPPEERLHQVTHHRQQSTPACSSSSGDRSPVAALEERVRELQALLVLLGKDLQDLEQTGCSCQDRASHHSSQSQTRRCSWCRTKSKLGILKREISTRAKKALRIQPKQDKGPPSELAAPWGMPPPYDSRDPQTPAHQPRPATEMPAAGRMFELDDAEICPLWELGESQAQMAKPTRPSTTSLSTSGSSMPRPNGSFPTPGSSFSDGFPGPRGPARPSRPSIACSMMSTSSSSFRGSHALVTPQTSRSDTSNSLPLISTEPGAAISGKNFCESPTTLEPGSGMNDQQDVPLWDRRHGWLWDSTSTLAEDTDDNVDNLFSGHQWKAHTDSLNPSDTGNPFYHSLPKAKEDDIEVYNQPSIPSFGAPENTRHSSWDEEVFELPCPSPSIAFRPATTKPTGYSPCENRGTSSAAHGIRQPRTGPWHPPRTTTRADRSRHHRHSRDGLSILSPQMLSPPGSPAAGFQPFTGFDDSALAPPRFHTYPPIPSSLPLGSYGFDNGPADPAPKTTPRTPRSWFHFPHTVPPPHLAPRVPVVTSPQLPQQSNPPHQRQSSLVGIGCKLCGFFPKGRDQRKKMERHKRSDRHRRRTKQDVVPRMLCPVPNPDGVSMCGRKFGRRDNLGQHLRRDHGGLELAECEPVRYELEDEDEVEMWDG